MKEEVFFMFELDLNKIKEQSMQFVDTARKAAMDIADKGKNQLDLAGQQNQLAKAERQLGAWFTACTRQGSTMSRWWKSILRTSLPSKNPLRSSRPT